MKKLLFAMSALAALSILAPSAGFAQFVYGNQVGVYWDEAATTINATGVLPNDQLVAYVILTKPEFTQQGDAPVTEIETMDFKMTFSAPGNMFKLNEALPAGSINIGDTSNLAAGLSYIVGIAFPVPVVNEQVTLVSMTFLVLNPAENLIYLGTVDTSSVPGAMSYQPANQVGPVFLVPMFAASGDMADPVASINGGVVATETETWGDIKSLYR